MRQDEELLLLWQSGFLGISSQSETAESASTCREVCVQEDTYLNNKRARENQEVRRTEDGKERQQGISTETA